MLPSSNKSVLLRKLDQDILDLTIEVDEEKFEEEEVLSADAYGEDVTWALKAIAGVLHSTSSTSSAQPLDLKTEAVPSTFSLTGAAHRLDLKS